MKRERERERERERDRGGGGGGGGGLKGSAHFALQILVIKSSEFRWSLRVCRLEHSGHLVVKKN